MNNLRAELVLNYGSSGSLFQQITNGAKFDIFMSADRIYPDKLKASGIVSGDVKVYALGKLVIWSNSIDVTSGMEILENKSVNRIAIAKPEIAPYGQRAIECLEYFHLLDKVKDKIVYADNIAQAAQFAQTGNAEVGFIALSLALSPGMKGSYFMIDPKSYKPLEQAMVLIKGRHINTEAVRFMDFLLGSECRTVFEKYGYILPL